MRLDAHQHYWQISRGDYGWITPDIRTLFRDFGPKDLAAHLKEHQIARTIVVQAAPTLSETEYLLRMSEDEPSIAGVVGWLDLSDPSYPAHFQHFSQHPAFIGFRVMMQDMEDPADMLSPAVLDAFRQFADRDTPVDLLVKADQLPVLLKLLKVVPHVRGVVDHIGKPNIRGKEYAAWATDIAQVAQYPKLYCKLSGMVTEADYPQGGSTPLAPYVHHVLRVFGPDRVMYGSDWPVCLMAATYDEVWQVAHDTLPATLTETERSGIFGPNAATFYKLSWGCAQPTSTRPGDDGRT